MLFELREREKGWGGERNIYMREKYKSITSPTCLDRVSNLQPFLGVWDEIPTN